MRFFCFRRRRRRLCLRPCPRSMEALDCAPDAPGRRSRSPSPDAALRPSPTTPVCGTGWEQSAVTPSTDAYNALAEQASCKACESASKRLKHTCTKAKHTGKRHTSPSVDIRHAKRSGTGPAAALTAPEAVQIPVASVAIDRGSSDVGVRAGEMHVLSEALSHISSSSEALHPSHLPVPCITDVAPPMSSIVVCAAPSDPGQGTTAVNATAEIFSYAADRR